MAKEEVDVQAERARMAKARDKKLEAEREARETEQRADPREEGRQNKPAVRATDGGAPGTKELNPIEMADNGEVAVAADEDESGEVTAQSTKKQLKAYLDAQGIAYEANASKDDLVALAGL